MFLFLYAIQFCYAFSYKLLKTISYNSFKKEQKVFFVIINGFFF